MTQFLRSAQIVSIAILLLIAADLSAAAIPEETINRAIERGVAALRKFQAADGSFCGTTHGSGPSALAVLTLLECGAEPSDEQVLKAVAVVRKDLPDLNRVYNLALAILLLDRLGDPQDEPLIHALVVRLLEGQASIGAWGYSTPEVSAAESQKLRTLIEQRTELKTVPGTDPASRPPPVPEIADRLKKLEQRRASQDAGATVDNSNTQFALLGLWVGRRHAMPTDVALRRAEAYFRATHSAGRWAYMPNTDIASDLRAANTCSGLLGLAIGGGIVREAQLRTAPERKDGKPPTLRDPLKDPLVQVAMNYVGSQVAELAMTGLDADVNLYRNLYFLWSVERVGMVYSVPAMGRVNWYQVGASAILRAQQPDGSWAAGKPGFIPGITADINTCFALLFLRRSNVAHDLAATLMNKPKQLTLRSGDEKDAAAEKPPVAPPGSTSEADRLARDLPTAPPERQEKIIADLRDGKGGEYTDALARVIPQVTGAAQKKTRDALAERLAHMNAATVRTKLKDDNAEVRRAAALACAMKYDKSFIPELIAALDDKDTWVIRSAAVALRTLTGQDFGPAATATADERAKAVTAWKGWWKHQNGR
jgi:hypothetical protein